MNTELRKRIEEAAKEYRRLVKKTMVDTPTYEANFRAGAEHGFKEAIEVAKEWLKEHSHIGARMIGSVHCTSLMTQGELLADFESDMNKLWEGEK